MLIVHGVLNPHLSAWLREGGTERNRAEPTFWLLSPTGFVSFKSRLSEGMFNWRI